MTQTQFAALDLHGHIQKSRNTVLFNNVVLISLGRPEGLCVACQLLEVTSCSYAFAGRAITGVRLCECYSRSFQSKQGNSGSNTRRCIVELEC